MPEAVYLVGAPGIGKSTVMELLIAEWTPGAFERPDGYAPFGYEVLFSGDRVPAGVYLGRHRGAFSGTDALAYTALPAAVRWVTEAELPERVYGEGARLAHERFLLPLHGRAALTVVHLVGSADHLAERRLARQSNQNPSWMKGAETRARKVVERVTAAGVRVVTVWAGAAPEVVAGKIIREISV